MSVLDKVKRYLVMTLILQRCKPEFDLLTDWVEKNPAGKVAANEVLLRKYGYDHATVTS